MAKATRLPKLGKAQKKMLMKGMAINTKTFTFSSVKELSSAWAAVVKMTSTGTNPAVKELPGFPFAAKDLKKCTNAQYTAAVAYITLVVKNAE